MLEEITESTLNNIIKEEEENGVYYRKCHTFNNLFHTPSLVLVESKIKSEKEVAASFEIVSIEKFLNVNKDPGFIKFIKTCNLNENTLFFVQVLSKDGKDMCSGYGKADVSDCDATRAYVTMNSRVEDLRENNKNAELWEEIYRFNQEAEKPGLLVITETFTYDEEDESYLLENPLELKPIYDVKLSYDLKTDEIDPDKTVIYQGTFKKGDYNTDLMAIIDKNQDFESWINNTIKERVDYIKNSKKMRKMLSETCLKKDKSFITIVHRLGMIHSDDDNITYHCITLDEYQKSQLPDYDKVESLLDSLKDNHFMVVLISNERNGVYSYMDKVKK